MKRTEAVNLLREYWDRPIFNVRIGICSPQLTDSDFESALEELDRCDRYTTEFMEYVYIYASEFCKDEKQLNEALQLFNLGFGRHRLNQSGGWT